MLQDLLIALVVMISMLVLIGLIWSAVLLPVRLGKQTKLRVIVEVQGPEPKLEATLRGLVWLHESGTLPGKIEIVCDTKDGETCRIAQAAERDYKAVILLTNGDKEWTTGD